MYDCVSKLHSQLGPPLALLYDYVQVSQPPHTNQSVGAESLDLGARLLSNLTMPWHLRVTEANYSGSTTLRLLGGLKEHLGGFSIHAIYFVFLLLFSFLFCFLLSYCAIVLLHTILYEDKCQLISLVICNSI